MSYPPNPLDKFRSHSYHHFLFAANSTNILTAFLQQGDTSFIEKVFGDEIKVEGIDPESEKLVMVVNPLIESNIFIDNVKFTTTMFNPPASTGFEKNLLLTGSGTGKLDMTILEPRGVGFLTKLRDINIKLKASSVGLTYMLMTVFVGHTYENTTEQVFGGNVLTLTLHSLKSVFTHTGGVYSAEFVLTQYGAPQKMGSLGVSHRNYNPQSKDGTLLSALKDYEKKMNDDLRDEWKKMGNSPASFSNKLTQVHFTIPPAWELYTMKTNNVDNAVEIDHSNPSNKSVDYERSDAAARGLGTSYNSSGGKVNIEDVLTSIIRKCPKVYENYNRDGIPHFWKIESALTSNKDTATMHFDVSEYMVPTPSADVADDSEENSGMIFDYIYTGKNSDILAYAMEISPEAGLTFVNVGDTGQRPNESYAEQKFSAADKVTGGGAVEDTNKSREPVQAIRSGMNDPQTKSEQHTQNIHSVDIHGIGIKQRKNYQLAAAAYVSKSVLTATLTIRGNPSLFYQYIPSVMPHKDSEYKAQKDEIHQNASDAAKLVVEGKGTPMKESASGPVSVASVAPTMVPMMVKVRVRTPEYDVAGNVVRTVPFWFDGWFKCMEVEHNFTGGQFTQVLKMVAQLPKS
jgi:hypothetical protein